MVTPFRLSASHRNRGASLQYSVFQGAFIGLLSHRNIESIYESPDVRDNGNVTSEANSAAE